ncbi:MAG: Hsp20/alpha crystallin family protein [Candidatus Dormibacteraeota bacterium]|nr:Hsp20/alpha crystallin family protein [Candidatus Dormibacteraeota bacterium]
MALVRWNPWSDLFSLHNQMDELFQSTLPQTESRSGGEHFSLPVDIRQSEEAFTIEASVPGFNPENVEVTFEDGVLSIKGTYSDEHEKAGADYVRRERRTGSVYRQIGLPAEVRPDEISAAFHQGVLTVTVPRAAKAQPKRIRVNTGAPSTANIVEGQASAS